MMRPARWTAFSLYAVTLMATSACSSSDAPAAPAKVDTAKVAAEVEAAIKTQVDAYAAHDADKAASVAAPNLVGMFHGEANVVGKDASKASMKAQMALPDVKLAISDPTVDVAESGDLAVHHATYRFSYTDPATKTPIVETGNWLAIFTRQPDGSMKMSKDIVADTPQAASK